MKPFHRFPLVAAALAVGATCAVFATGVAWAQSPRGEVIQGAPDAGIRLGKNTSAKPTHVCIDTTSSAAWTLLYSTADAGCAKAGMQRVPLAEFAQPATREMLRRRVLFDFMPGFDALAQVQAYLHKFPATPIGYTWEGGMAITAGDYTAAEQRHAAYLKDPQGYVKSQTGK